MARRTKKSKSKRRVLKANNRNLARRRYSLSKRSLYSAHYKKPFKKPSYQYRLHFDQPQYDNVNKKQMTLAVKPFSMGDYHKQGLQLYKQKL